MNDGCIYYSIEEISEISNEKVYETITRSTSAADVTFFRKWLRCDRIKCLEFILPNSKTSEIKDKLNRLSKITEGGKRFIKMRWH